MTKTQRMLIDASHEEETRVVIADEDQVHEFDFVTAAKEQIKGNIYLGKITRVEPSLQAAFVEYGGGKQGFLSFSEIHPDYYQIPQDDKARLLEEEQAEADEEEAAEEQEEKEREERKSRRSRGGRGRGRRNRRGRKREEETSDENAETSEGDSTEDAAANKAESEEKTTYAEAKVEEEDAVVTSEPAEQEVETEEAEATEEAETEDESIEESDNSDSDDDDVEDEDEDEEDTDDDAETLGGDDVEEASDRRRKHPNRRRRYKINEVIKRGQIVLVQAVKEERGNKGASVTTYISLAGRYCVLMPNSLKGGGISRKISGGEERKRLKEVAAEMKELRGLNMIIRTAGIGRTKAEIKRDYEYLVKLWNKVREDTLQSSAPALIHEESNIIKRSIRDLYTSDVEEILVEGETAYKEAKAFMKLLMPSHAPRVKQYKEDLPIFSSYGVEEELMSIYDPVAKMPSGGYVVMHPTEALISIDVNSGRSTSERNVEETALKTNLEAAKEIARQLRLRDMAGLIVIDFIDMNYGKNRRLVEKAMKEALKHDRAKIQVARISTFGLMELSRQRLRPNIMEASAQECTHCGGTGFVRSVETVGIQIIRLIEKEATYNEYKTMRICIPSDVALHLLNDKRKVIQKIEEQYDIEIVVEIDNNIANGKFKIYKTDHDDKEVLHDDGKGERKRRRRGGRGRNRNKERGDKKDAKEKNDSQDEPIEDSSEGNSADDNTEAKDEKKPRRSRGKRGGRGRNKKDASKEENASEESTDSGETEAPAEVPEAKKKAPEPEPASEQAVVANTASDLDAGAAKIETLSEPDENSGKKKKGWWSKVIEG